MARFAEGEVRIGGTRTGAARKITDWSLRMPDGKDAKFEIQLDHQDDVMIFIASSDHPWFKDSRLFDSDLNVLKEKISAEAAVRIGKDREGTWEPACLIRMQTIRRQDQDYPRGSLEFNLNFESVEFMPGEVRGNRGQTTIRNGWRQEVIIQRGLEDRFGSLFDELRGMSILDPEARAIMADPVRSENDKPMTRIVSPGDGGATKALVDVLERFFAALEGRMSPARLALEGPARPEELVELMRACASQTTKDDGAGQ